MKITLIALFVLLSPMSSALGREKFIIGSVVNIQKIEDELDGCACRLDTIFVSTVDGSKAWMNFSDKVTELTLIKATRPSTGTKTFYRKYKAGAISITVDFQKFPKSADENEESEGSKVNATITIIKGHHKDVFKVSGLCAC